MNVFTVLPLQLTLLILLLTLFLLFYVYLTSSYDYWKKRGVQYVSPTFPFGNFSRVATLKTSIGEFLEEIYNKSKENFIGFYIFGRPHLLVRSPDIIKQILVSDFNYFSDRAIESDEKADPISSFLLLTMKNPEWKLMRTKMSPLFTSSKLKTMTQLIDKCADDMCLYLKENQGNIETKEFCAKFTTDVISSCAFGVDAGCFQNENSPFRVAGRKMMDTTIANGLRFTCYFLVPSFVRFFKIALFNGAAINFLKDAFWQTIKYREDTNKKRNDLVDMLINLKDKDDIGNGIKFEGDRVVAQAIQFFSAGFETTSGTMSYALYQLCLNQEIQDKLRVEIQSTLKTHGSFTYEALLSMKYLEQVMMETLRMYPPLPFLDRKCMQDYKVPGNNMVIEKGTPLFISMLGLHYDPEYFPEPNKYDPERFNDENVDKRHTYAYVPFGHGPHNCIGERFGMLSSKMGLAHILNNFRVEKCSETVETITYNPTSFTLQAHGGIYIKCTKLNSN